MKWRVISIGKIKQSFILEGEAEYLRRFPRDVELTIEELGVEKFSSLPKEELQKKEFELLRSKVKGDEFLILLDETGKIFSSKEFAQKLESLGVQGRSRICFAIGGAFGWSDEAKKSADLLFSVSELTFPYQLCRFILVEQLYRAYSLIRGLPYHK